MVVEINRIYDKVSKTKDGRSVVSALFWWDGKDRCVRIPAGVHKVGDKVEVVLIEYYNREKNEDRKWWEYKGAR